MIYLPPARWMTDMRDRGVAERDLQRQLGARTKEEYSQMLLQYGLPIVRALSLKVQAISIKETTQTGGVEKVISEYKFIS